MIMERKEAIEVVKKNYPHCAESGTQFETALRTLIPELQESEDAKISKEIIKFIATTPKQRNSHPKWIAWLEKQGEQKSMPQEYADAFDEFMSHIPEKEPEFSESCYNYDDMVSAIQFGIKWQQQHNSIVKVEQKPIEEVNGEDYGIDGLYHAQRILEQTLGNVEGYQSDDGILEHKCAISAVKKLSEQKPAVYIPNFRVGDLVISTKNPHLTYKVLEAGHINENGEPEYKVEIFVDGKPSHPSNIKYIRIQMMDECGQLISQHNEWSEEDETTLNRLIAHFDWHGDTRFTKEDCQEATNWLKSIRPNHWKPSKEQMWALDIALEYFYHPDDGAALESLRTNLQKLL